MKTLFTGFSPNTAASDVKRVLRVLTPFLRTAIWKRNTEVEMVEQQLGQYFGSQDAMTFDSGRSALLAAITACDIQKGDEVLVQAYTCVVVINAIRWAGATPVYVDVDDQLNMDPVDAAKKITDKTKVMIIQHTFGHAAQLDLLIPLAKKHNLITIEDCAHALGGEYHGKKLGTFADMAMLSFGSDKVISSVRGGACIVNNKIFAPYIQEYHQTLPAMPKKYLLQHLLHIPIFFIGKKLYSITVGKALLAFTKKYNITNKIIYQSEKRGVHMKPFPSTYPNALAFLLLGQLDRLAERIAHRAQIAEIYKNGLTKNITQPLLDAPAGTVYLRYPLFVKNPGALQLALKKQGIMLGDWYQTVVAPKDIQFASAAYTMGDCTQAERFAQQSVNLPTNIHISPSDAQRIVDAVNKFYA